MFDQLRSCSFYGILGRKGASCNNKKILFAIYLVELRMNGETWTAKIWGVFKQLMLGTGNYLSSVGIFLYTALHSATNMAYLSYKCPTSSARDIKYVQTMILEWAQCWDCLCSLEIEDDKHKMEWNILGHKPAFKRSNERGNEAWSYHSLSVKQLTEDCYKREIVSL